MAIVTFETVAQAAEALQQAGNRPSVRALIAALGGGSPNSVLKHLREWQAGRPLVKPSDAEIDDAILAAIRKQIDRSAQAGAAVAEARAAEAEDNLNLYVDAQQAAEQQIATLTAERDQAREQVLGITEQLTDAQRDAENERQHAIETAAALRSEIADERERTNQAGAALAKAEVRLEQLPALLGEVAALKVSLGEQQTARAVAEQQAAVLTSQLEALRVQFADLRATVARIEADRDQAREQAHLSQGEAKEQARRIGEQEAIIASLRADLTQTAQETTEAAPPAAPEFSLEPSPLIEPETTAPAQKKAPAKRRTPPPPAA